MFAIWSEPRADKESPAYARDALRSRRTYLADVVAAEQRLLERNDEALEQLGRQPS